MLRNLMIAAAALATTACTTMAPSLSSEELAAPVIAAERAFAARHQQVSVKQAFLEYSADDGVAVRPAGVVNVKTDLAGWPDRDNTGQIVWWPIYAGAARSGDLGFTTGPAIYGGKSYGGYFTIWKKQADGSWKWVLDQGTGASTVAPVSKQGDDVLVMPVSTAAPTNPDSAWQEVLALDTELGQAMARDTSALTERLAPDAHLFGLSITPAVGPEAARAALAARPRQLAMKPEGGGISAAGDFAWTYGYGNWSEAGKDVRGPYVRVWQRRPSGWVIVAENLNAFGRG
ncbi:MAG TPA: nuclear transport factor 2 family protein [Allosphingosinicella sp.]|uniref:nuclear transport factor 2 family protein n=1 Tax=Allosphingosinicella sp. TaxID=2823234 RepID=UPI002ED98F70